MLAAALAVASSSQVWAADTPRQVQVERNSERVMPFSMATATHSFVATPTGGVQTVTVRNGDLQQIRLVRSHLRKEAGAFARGDFSDPATIHGRAMPGLRALQAGATRITVRYSELRDGAAIAYTTREPALVAAVHAWFKAQTSDHGAHATMEMKM